MSNSIDQYTALYREHRAVLDDGAPEVLNRERRKAFEALTGPHALAIPRKGQDGYVYTDLNAMFAPDYGINLARLPFRADVASAFRCGVPNVSTLTGVIANDTYGASDGLNRNCPDGLTVCTFRQAADRLPGVLDKYYGTVAPADNAAVALNTMLAQDGVLVHVARGVEVEKPLQLVAVLGGVNSPLLAIRRVLVVLEPGARLRLLGCDHAAASEVPVCADTVVEMFVDNGAALEYYDIQESALSASRYTSLGARLQADASLRLCMATLRCGATRNDIRVSLDGEHATANISGMAIADAGQTADNSATVLHNAPHCHSDQLFKYVVRGTGRGAFEGLIKVAGGSHHTEAYQNNRNMLAGADARMHTRPQLEIYCDDVRANHGAATGQIDADALFYMQSRGIPADEARTMLMQAFMADVIDNISLTPLRDRMRHLTEQRLAGDADCAATCADCSKL